MVVVPFDQIYKTMLGECFNKRNIIVSMFVIISLTFLSVGANWPKQYMAFTVIQVDSSNILQPLMRGAAETTKPIDKVANAREIILGEKIIDRVLHGAGWTEEESSNIDNERIKNDIRQQVRISDIGDNLIKIEFQNSSPDRAFKTTRLMADFFIEEGKKEKIKESQSAYTFIEKQVKKYLTKLTKVEDELRKFRSENPESHPGLENEISNNVTKIQRDIKQNELLLSETEIKKESLEKQLSGEAAITISQSKEGIYRTKISELQSRLEALRLDYMETYPDIVRTKNQINDIMTAMNNEIKNRESAKKKTSQSGKPYVDNAILMNPFYQQLRADLSATETEVATLETRIKELKRMLVEEHERSRKVYGGEAVLTKLTRNYEVNKEIYQDLLKRLENARVSKNLDEDHQGLTFRIQEPAKLPLLPSGLRFIHFAIAGLVLGILIPLSLIYLLLHIDPRIRFSKILTSELNVPLLSETISVMKIDDVVLKRNMLVLLFAVAAVFVIYGIIGWFKFSGII